MTTKRKIVFGFVLMIVLLAGVAVSGYHGLQTASDNFVTFARQANVDVYVGHMSTSLTRAIQRVYNFIRTKEPGLMDRALGDMDAFSELSTKARGVTKIPERAAILAELEKQNASLKNEMVAIRTAIVERDKFFADVLKKRYGEIQSILLEMGGDCHQGAKL